MIVRNWSQLKTVKAKTMKKIINVPLALIIIFMISSCHQNKPAAIILKNKIITDTVRTSKKQDTLIFKDVALSSLVQQTYKYFSIYDTINPLEDQYDIRKFKLNKTELDSLYRNSGDPVSVTMMNGSAITQALSVLIINNMQKILGWKNIGEYNLSLLFKNYIGIAKSPDDKLYCFSFDAKTGGTYHEALSFIYYNPLDGGPQRSFSIKEDDIFNKDGYETIDTVHTKQGVKYIMTGSVVGCTTCRGNYIDLVHFEKGKFVADFSYTVKTRTNSIYQEETDNSPTIEYNARLHHININYITNDMEPVCNCGKSGAPRDSNVSYEYTGHEDEIKCIYAFNGKTFILKRKTEKPAEPLK